jgi:hypothetical protein
MDVVPYNMLKRIIAIIDSPLNIKHMKNVSLDDLWLWMRRPAGVKTTLATVLQQRRANAVGVTPTTAAFFFFFGVRPSLAVHPLTIRHRRGSLLHGARAAVAKHACGGNMRGRVLQYYGNG